MNWCAMHALRVLLYLPFSIRLCLCVGNGDKTLRLLGLLPTSGTGWIGGMACLSPIQMALEDIEANTDILQGYNLTYSWIDSKCNPGVAVYRMVQKMYKDPPYVMLLGDGCSIGSEATAQVSFLWNLTQLSYGSSSPLLSDRKRFPKFFRLAGPDQMLNPTRIAIMRYFNWKKVATINQAEEFFSFTTDDFVKRVKDTEISIISQEIFASDPKSRVENLKKHDARIIMTAMYEDKARKTLCAAYKVGLYGPKIVWAFFGWYSSEFWRTNLDDHDCTMEQMNAAVEGSILTSFFYRNPVAERGIANMTAEEFDVRHKNYHHYLSEFQKFNFVGGPCYDHIWVAALALNCTDMALKAAGYPKQLHEFTYEDFEINEMIFSCMSNISLTGVTGNIAFATGADPDKIVKIERIEGGLKRQVGLFRTDLDPKQIIWQNGGIKWKDGNVPRDSTDVYTKEMTIPWAVYIPMTACAAFGIILAIAFLIFNIVHRNNQTVKLSSPNINNVLLLGCMLCYSTVFVKPSETDNPVVCKIRVFCFSLGFTIAFGALFSKTWRVYKIFTNKKLLRMRIRDYQLLAIICVLVAVVLCVLIVWEIVSPQIIIVQSLTKEVYLVGNDQEVWPFVRMCHSENGQYFTWVLYVIEGTLLAFGTFLAWETRHIKIDALNDSYQIGLCLYNVVVLSGVGLTLSLLLDQQIAILYGMTSGCLIIGTTITQAVVFVPKVRAVYRNQVWVGDISEGGSRPHTQFGVTNFNNHNHQFQSRDACVGSSSQKNDSSLHHGRVQTLFSTGTLQSTTKA